MAALSRLSTGVGIVDRSAHTTRDDVVEEIEENEVQHQPLSLAYAPGSKILAMASECRSMVGAIISDFPQTGRFRSHEEQMHEVDDFLGPPRRPALELQPWKPITMCMINNESTRLNIRDVNKFLIFANKQAMLAIDIYEPFLLKHDLHFKA